MIAPSPSPDACSATVLRARGRRLCKTILCDGAIVGFDSAKTFDLAPVPLTCLADLEVLLIDLADRCDCCIVRGAPIDPARLLGQRRLSRSDATTGEPATLRDVPRHWIALDLDGLPLPAGTDPRDLAGCYRAVLPLLPAAFHDAATIVQATGSHGIKPGARLRAWCWLNRAMTELDLKEWLRGAPVDQSIFRCAQPIYTATPLFLAGTADPLPLRLVKIPGAATVIVPPMATCAPKPRPVAAPPRWPDATRSTRYALAALTRAAATIRQGNGARHPLALREAIGLSRLVRAGLVTEGELERVIAGALDVPGRNTPPTEAGDIVRWAMQHGTDGPLPEGMRR